MNRFRKSCRLSWPLALAGAGALLAAGSLPAQTHFAVLAGDGAWNCYSEPHALFHRGVLYYGYARNSDGKAVLSAFDPRSGVKNDLWVSTLNERDEFNVPGLLVLPDDRLLAVHARHNTDPFFSFRISTSPNPVTAAGWGGEQRTANSGASISYANLVQLAEEGGRIFNFTRSLNSNPTLFASTNGGVAWSAPQPFIQAGRGSARSYLKVCSDGRRRLDFIFTDGHPRETSNSLYHVFYRAGAIHQSDGTVLKSFSQLPLDLGAGETGSFIYQYNEAPQTDPDQWIPGGRAWCWDLAGNPAGQPVCVFTVRVPNAAGVNWQDRRIYYYYARWTGTNWQKRFLAHAGRPLYEAEEDYAAGICVDPENPDVVYLSSNAAQPFTRENFQQVPLQPRARYELWRGVTTNGGLSFTWQALTTNSVRDNLRPCVPRGQNGSPAVLWFRGDYRSYTSYQCEVVGLFSTPLPGGFSAGVQRIQGPLTNAAQVRALAQADARERIPVKLRGVVTAEAQPGREGFALQDETAGIYLRGPVALSATLQRGDLIEVEGVSDPGEFAPFVWLTSLRKIGTGKIPPPRPVSFEQLINGRADAQWVEVSGVVRNCEPIQSEKKYKLDLATGGGRLAVHIVGRVIPEKLVDAEVRLAGVSFYQVNKNRQVISPLLVVPQGGPVVIETPAPFNPYAEPARPLDSLLQFAPQGAYGHRVHVRGVVTHHLPGEALWIRDDTRGLRVQIRQTEALQPGDTVDVLGFPNRGEYSPVLEDAVFQKAGSGLVPEPVQLSNIVSVLNHDAGLVEVGAVLVSRQLTAEGWAFVLQEAGVTFRALLRSTATQPSPPPEAGQPGSRMRVTGICSVLADPASPSSGVSEPRSFQILLRSEADLRVVNPPPWWNWKRIVWALGVFAGGLLLAVAAVIGVAQRRLREQAQQRALAEAEFSAILAERNRMAREIHDTLAQGLGAISMQLELMKSGLPPESGAAAQHLGQAQKLVRDSLADARNSIWNMRSQVLETGDLPSALTDILQQLSGDTGVTGRLRVAGRARRLPPVTENNLLRIGQEAITNAVKHAHAKQLDVELEFADKEVSVRVRDDGRGFNPDRPPAGEGGFGLLGMRERADQMQGQFAVQSQPGRGTEVRVTVTVPG